MAKGETIGEMLKRLSESSESSEEDSRIMQAFLRRKCGFPAAIVTMGIVYFVGHGTMEYPPTSIHSTAKLLLKIAEDEKTKAATGG